MPRMTAPDFGTVEVPYGVNNLDSFREWVHSGKLDEKLPVHFIDGHVWLDFHMEELFSHNQVKAAIGAALHQFVQQAGIGLYLVDGMLLTNDDAEVGTEPDGMFVSFESFDQQKVWTTAGETTGAEATELVGTPDLVIEVISPSSLTKDTDWLMKSYHAAEIPEYWVVDARELQIRFDIFRYTSDGYVASRKSAGWVKSAVFSRSFRMRRNERLPNFPTYTIEIR